MSFDFDTFIERKNTDSLKWHIREGELPLWVADMDFETAPCIKEAIQKRAEHGIYGYTVVPREWKQSYINWWKNRHSFEINPLWIIFCTGVIPAISSLVRKLTTPAEKVLIQTPCYNNFFNSIINNGRIPLESPLGFDGKKYFIDFNQLEKDLSDPQVSLMILCNPQNPTGNIWTKEELCEIGRLCKQYGVKVISDEIHCDVTKPGTGYTPFASCSETCAEISVTCIAPTKCFNIAGINTSAVVVPDEFLRHKVWRSLNTDEIAEPNVFAVTAAIAAFNEGGQWLDEMNKYVYKNRIHAGQFISSLSDNFTVIDGDATYLLWVKVNCDGDDFARRLRNQTGLFVNGGNEYGKGGEEFIRINLACPESMLEDALNRLKAFVEMGS